MTHERLETEIKLPLQDPEPWPARLEAEGFRRIHGPQRELSVLWDRDGILAASGSALRLRRYGTTASLTWKGARIPDDRLKIRPELETAIEDAEAMMGILTALGFRPVLSLEKLREVWERPGLQACLDRTPFGAYLELEGDPPGIFRMLEALGLDPSRAEPRSYPELFVAHGLAAPLAPGPTP